MVQTQKGKSFKILAIIGVLAVVGGVGVFLFLTKPWILSVKEIVQRGSMCMSSSNMAVISKRYQYYVDLDGSLRVALWDKENESFYAGEGNEIVFEQNEEAVGDFIDGIQVTKKKLYMAYYGGYDQGGNPLPGAMISMNHDGTEQKELFEIRQDTSVPVYVKLSNGGEYFYYLAEDDAQEGKTGESRLYRYNIKKDCAEPVVKDAVEWYGLNGKYLYYGCFEEEQNAYHSYRARLDGEDVLLVDADHGYCDMFVENGQIYMLQTTNRSGELQEGIVACDEKLVPLEDGNGIFDIRVKEKKFVAGNGCIFYGDEESEALYKVWLDGTEKEVILQGYQYNGLSYQNKMLYFRDGKMSEDGTFVALQSYLVSEDGKEVVDFKLERNSLVTDNGLCYMIENGAVNILGYQGEASEVIVPAEIQGYPVAAIDREEFYSTKVAKEQLDLFISLHTSDITYEEKDGNIVITKCFKDAPNIAIPSEIGGKKVTEIGAAAFASMNVESIYLPEKLEIIGEYAFQGCEKLEWVVFPDTLKVIGSYAFGNCSFQGVDIVIPEGVEELQEGIFYQCTPNSVSLPSTVERVGKGFLEGCAGAYMVDSKNKEFMSKDGVIFSASGKILYAFPYSHEEAYMIPQGVETIWGGAFESCLLKEVTLPEGLKEIGEEAFWYSAVEKINGIPQSVEKIGSKAFVNTKLEEISVSQDTEMANDSFDGSMEVHYF